MLVWRLVTGALPVDGFDQAALTDLYTGRIQVPSLCAIRADVNEGLNDAVSAALSFDPAGRPAGAGSFSDLLRSAWSRAGSLVVPPRSESAEGTHIARQADAEPPPPFSNRSKPDEPTMKGQAPRQRVLSHASDSRCISHLGNGGASDQQQPEGAGSGRGVGPPRVVPRSRGRQSSDTSESRGFASPAIASGRDGARGRDLARDRGHSFSGDAQLAGGAHVRREAPSRGIPPPEATQQSGRAALLPQGRSDVERPTSSPVAPLEADRIGRRTPSPPASGMASKKPPAPDSGDRNVVVQDTAVAPAGARPRGAVQAQGKPRSFILRDRSSRGADMSPWFIVGVCAMLLAALAMAIIGVVIVMS